MSCTLNTLLHHLRHSQENQEFVDANFLTNKNHRLGCILVKHQYIRTCTAKKYNFQLTDSKKFKEMCQGDHDILWFSRANWVHYGLLANKRPLQRFTSNGVSPFHFENQHLSYISIFERKHDWIQLQRQELKPQY